ncbi:OLC1v1019620C1 [Oldenlandia corymbosa var. corymbosa]|uniref:OLC1v1019620C1 n=1 Tax=Oldenlandia corymbosa var. corymbosa TaxID=529605 RepID=A0AAV1EEC9_OLDCO|nr:OLC1v1019620C1 [Oldenlandia corymbosa var. corymbosa]
MDDNFSIDWEHKFPQLEALSIQVYRHLRAINISSRSLKKILLISNCKLLVAQFDVPNIAIFEYQNYLNYDDRDELMPDLPKLSFTYVLGGWISCIRLECKDNINNSWLLKLEEFLTELSGSETLINVYFVGNVGFNVDKMKDSLPFYGGGQLKIRVFVIAKSATGFDLSTARAILNDRTQKAFSITNDFLPEEEEEVQRENAWAFEKSIIYQN